MTEVPQVPYADKGGEGTDKEGKFIIDRSLRILRCMRCGQPLYYKENKKYCANCKKFRTMRTSLWVGEGSNIEFITKEQLTRIIEG